MQRPLGFTSYHFPIWTFPQTSYSTSFSHYLFTSSSALSSLKLDFFLLLKLPSWTKASCDAANLLVPASSITENRPPPDPHASGSQNDDIPLRTSLEKTLFESTLRYNCAIQTVTITRLSPRSKLAPAALKRIFYLDAISSGPLLSHRLIRSSNQ